MPVKKMRSEKHGSKRICTGPGICGKKAIAEIFQPGMKKAAKTEGRRVYTAAVDGHTFTVSYQPARRLLGLCPGSICSMTAWAMTTALKKQSGTSSRQKKLTGGRKPNMANPIIIPTPGNMPSRSLDTDALDKAPRGNAPAAGLLCGHLQPGGQQRSTANNCRAYAQKEKRHPLHGPPPFPRALDGGKLGM